jgi:predicted O-methyltransferase YrrM
MPTTTFADAWGSVADVDGWLTEAQARRLWDRASALGPGDQVVEIGSFHGRSATVLAKAVPQGVTVVAIDPHLGSDRGPREIEANPDEGNEDHERFLANLRRAGVDGTVRHVRKLSQDAHGDVDGPIPLLYIDGAHRFGPARDDIVRWGARVPAGGTMLIHDSFNAVGVMLAQLVALFLSRRFRYVGRSGSMAEYRREDVRGVAGVARNALRQAVELGYFAQSVAIKVLLTLKQPRLARALGHDPAQPWPF